MKLEKQVVSLELSKKLKELGVKQKSCFDWVLPSIGDSWKVWEVSTYKRSDRKFLSAYTVAELGEMLPQMWIDTFKHSLEWQVGIKQFKHVACDEYSEANARAKMLIYLIENNLIKL